MPVTPPPTQPPAWPEHLIALARRLGGHPTDGVTRGQVWLVLSTALLAFLRRRSRPGGTLDAEDLKDIAAQKALEVMQHYDRGQWDPARTSAGQVVTMLQRVARNGWVDEMRRRKGREHGVVADREIPATGATPDTTLARREFAAALVDCASRLQPAHRTAWLLRLLYDMPSREIAAHPEVRLNVGHVDVILQRCRRQVSQCLAGKGLGPADLQPGVFVELWRAFRSHPRLDEVRA